MSDKHEILDVSSLRGTPAKAPKSVDELARERLRGRSFSQLSPQEKDELLMIVGVQLGLIAPEAPEH